MKGERRMIVSDIADYFTLKVQIKELQEQLNRKKEIIEDYLLQSGEDILIFEYNDTECFVIERKISTGEKLDKEGLSFQTKIPKDEMKTPYDWAKLAEQGKISAEMIAKFTTLVTNDSIKISRKKRPSKSNNFKNPAKQLSFDNIN